MTKETLYCEIGRHKWTREAGKRGRKPTNCDKHKPAPQVKVSGANGIQHLHCEIGNHNWDRPSVRGVKPRNCPKHKPVPVSNSTHSTGNGTENLHCEIGDHNWERIPARGRKPRNCPEHSGPVVDNLAANEVLLSEYPNGDAMVLILDEEFVASLPKVEAPAKRGPGRPRIHETQEDRDQAARERSLEKVNRLEADLKLNGTHISQQAPYSLYKLVKGIAGEQDAQYDYVRDFSPLAKAQFMNQFPDRFDSGIYYFMRDGEKVDE